MMNKLLFAIFIWSATIVSASDGRLHLVHADRTTGLVINNEQVRVLLGNVYAYQDTLNIWCDKAEFYEAREQAHFIGNVLLNDGHHRLRADEIYYYSRERKADCRGDVRIGGENDSLFAQRFIYYFKAKNAIAEKDVFMLDRANNAEITGEKARYDSQSRHSVITKNARLKMVQSESDTLLIFSDRMEYFGNEPRKALAMDSVKIFRGNLRANCDSAAYLVDEEKVWLEKNPVAWQDDNRMTGNQIFLRMDSVAVNEIILYKDAEMLSKADSLTQRKNLLSGKNIRVKMKEKKVDRIIARDNARSRYVLFEDDVERGTNSASADSIIIYFRESEMDSIIIIGGTEGVFLPPDFKGEVKGDQNY